MTNYADGQRTSLIGYTVSEPRELGNGKIEPNPRNIVPKGKRKAIGFSIRCFKEVDFGDFHHVEVNCWKDAEPVARNLNLQVGDSLDAYGRFEISKGKKKGVVFEKLHVNGAKQIRLHTSRPATPTEL